MKYKVKIEVEVEAKSGVEAEEKALLKIAEEASGDFAQVGLVKYAREACSSITSELNA